MKNQFLLAFNELCKEKNLPSETVLEALKNALISAYRRNTSVSSVQKVTADLDPRTGELAIFAEKEVAESIIDNRTEVLLEDARKVDPKAELGDLVMVESTPQDFGRIAAQTAKQVILQRVREAERDHLFEEFIGREGELVNGIVQGVSGGNITIGLGRTEAILPRSQQVSGERYKPHDRIRVYILEVRKTNRGPQICVSRGHRNLLRRLFELEVPEIYNGQVDIKSIAREAGARSKVAVKAMQPGVDPVGACVGMRGVRIQSIVRELNDEKIDVIEWDIDPKNFINKALSPARVSQVLLDDDPVGGRTATVIVPDDQLSLAIGREGQNARLAAKLTGWRIDIKSLTEAARDSLKLLNHPKADATISADETLLNKVREVLAKKEAHRPITAEDYGYINRLVMGVEARIIAARAAEHDEVRKTQTDARGKVPSQLWQMDLEELDLPMSVHNLLLRNNFAKVGDVLYQLELDPSVFFEINGLEAHSLDRIKTRMAELLKDLGPVPLPVTPITPSAETPTPAAESPVAPVVPPVRPAPRPKPVSPVKPTPKKWVEKEDPPAADFVDIESLFIDPNEIFGIDDISLMIESARQEAPKASPVPPKIVPDPASSNISEVVPTPTATEAEVKETEKKEAEKKPPIPVRVVRPNEIDPEKEKDKASSAKKKAQPLIFNEKAGRPVAQKKRKKNQEGWSDDGDEEW